MPLAVGVLRRCAEAIAVGIGGDEQIELFAAGERKETIVSHRKLWIWRGDRWEMPVWRELLSDHMHIHAEVIEHSADRRTADTVQRREANGQRRIASALQRRHRFFDGAQIIGKLVFKQTDLATGTERVEIAFDSERLAAKISVGIARDDASILRQKLTAICVVGFVAIVVAWIVAGSDHDTGGAAKMAHAPGEDRRRRWLTPEQHRNAVLRQHEGSRARKFFVVQAAVGGDHHRLAFFADLAEPFSNASRGPGDGETVETVGAHAHDAAQASCAKGKRGAEGFVQRDVVCVKHSELCAFGVGEVGAGAPGLICFACVHERPPS